VPQEPDPAFYGDDSRMMFSIRSIKAVVRWTTLLLFCADLCLGSQATQPSPNTKQSSAKSGKSSKSKAHSGTRKGRHSKKASWRRGQQKMDSDRARQVQAALIREHYLAGEPTGVWDQRSQNAMVRFQAANGWQTKVIPDSRALIKLGLGPSNDHLLNPDSAMTSPLQPTSQPGAPTSTMEHSSPASTPLAPTSAGSAEPVSDPHK
jgi:peptidoglycan hydrolase-like protein with peptidoglycan-binding domain